MLQHHVDSAIGVYIIDRYTYYVLEFLEKVHPNSKRTMSEFVSYYLLCIYGTDFLVIILHTNQVQCCQFAIVL